MTEGGGFVHAQREKVPGGTVAEELNGVLRNGGEDDNEDEGDEAKDDRACHQTKPVTNATTNITFHPLTNTYKSDFDFCVTPLI